MERVYRMEGLDETVDGLKHEPAYRPSGVAELREWVLMWESDDGHHRRRYKDKNIARNAAVAVALPAINWNVPVLHDPRGAYPVQMQCWDCKRVARVMDRCVKCHRYRSLSIPRTRSSTSKWVPSVPSRPPRSRSGGNRVEAAVCLRKCPGSPMEIQDEAVMYRYYKCRSPRRFQCDDWKRGTATEVTAVLRVTDY